ncbi:MAG TPA: SAM-dependent methyltransferase [Candidatus Marinimicrobia bacterium]|nr:SAM-dependent methyltransferase [Candidatus Neomarinimicrobiota bacterium]
MKDKQCCEERWKMAQQYEHGWWKNYQADIQWYREVAERIEELVDPYLKIQDDTRILEIGAGPCGPISFFKSNYRYAVEPLNDYFEKEYADVRDSLVQYKKGIGEKLFFEDSLFDLIVSDNVLDHCRNPWQVLLEMKRVLKNGGLIFLRVHVYTVWALFMRKILEWFRIDRGHPYSFSRKKLIRIVGAQKLKILQVEADRYLDKWLMDMRSGSPKRMIKSLFLINSVDFILLITK